MHSPMLIAEAGVNHNGETDRAVALIDIAAQAQADIVKFQTFDAQQLTAYHAPKAAYQFKDSATSQQAMLKQLSLPKSVYAQLKQHAQQQGVEFLATAFDRSSLDFLLQQVGLQRLKIASGELTNLPLLLAHAHTGLPIILSTGMARVSEIETALTVLAFGYLHPAHPKDLNECFEAYCSDTGQQALQQQVTLLHCTSSYPAPLESIHLRAMPTLGQLFGLDYGYSDHSLGMAVGCAAVTLGACVIEKHFTQDTQLPGPDHAASLSPAKLAEFVQALRSLPQALGSTQKRPQADERANRLAARKSLVARCAIRAGDRLNEHNITAKRPEGGLSPAQYWSVLGTVAQQDYAEDDFNNPV